MIILLWKYAVTLPQFTLQIHLTCSSLYNAKRHSLNIFESSSTSCGEKTDDCQMRNPFHSNITARLIYTVYEWNVSNTILRYSNDSNNSIHYVWWEAPPTFIENIYFLCGRYLGNCTEKHKNNLNRQSYTSWHALSKM